MVPESTSMGSGRPGPGDVLRGGGQPSDRAEPRPGDDRGRRGPRVRRRRGRRGTARGARRASVRSVDVVDCASRMARPWPTLRAATRRCPARVVDPLVGLAAGDGDVRRADDERGGTQGIDGGAVGEDVGHLDTARGKDGDRGAGQLVGVDEVRGGHGPGAQQELGVELGLQLGGDREVRRCRGEGGGQADRQRDEQRDPRMQAHGAVSRRTYPTPRTVWTSRISPSSSVLRRR